MKGETRHRPSTRAVAAALAFPLAIGGGVLVLQRGPVALVPAAVCPGALEGLAIALARIGRSAPLGLWLLGADRVLAVAAVAVFAVLARRASGAWLAAAAAALTFAAQPAFAPRLSVFGPVSVLVAGLVFLALLYGAPASGVDWRVWLGLLLSAGIAPSATLPLAVVAGWHIAAGPSPSPHRWRTVAIAGAALVAGIAALMAAIPGRPPAFTLPISCLLPSWSGVTQAHAADELESMLTSAGVFACSLAGLGAFSRLGALRERRAWTVIAYAVASMAAAWAGLDSARLLEPLVVAFWVLVAVGLAEAVRACRGGFGGRLAAGLLIVLLPLPQLSARPDGTQASAQAGPRGQERLTLQGVGQVLRILPAASTFVVEDATMDLFLRALDGTWQRAGKTLQLVPRRVAEVAAALGHPDTHVFALPAAQAELWRIGFRLTAVPDVPGVAEVREGGACTVVDHEWRGLPDLPRSSMLTLVAEVDGDKGPIVMYVASERRPATRALDWPPLTTRGFHETSYDRAASADQSRLDAGAREDGVPAGSLVLSGPHVTRLELWRTPGAPNALTVELGAIPLSALARLQPNAAVQHLTVCPAFPFTPQPPAMLR
jgi:hypothetical protein